MTKRFEAKVVAIRQKYPRLHVRYLRCVETGSTHALSLPQPIEAYVHAGMVHEM